MAYINWRSYVDQCIVHVPPVSDQEHKYLKLGHSAND
jgi:hypothetical protein